MRLAVATVAAAVLQLTAIPHVALGGLVPDLFLLATILLAFRQEPERASLQGFALGLLQDSLAGTPLGLRAFVLSLVGFLTAFVGQQLLSASRVARGLLVLGMAVVSGVLTVLTLGFFRGFFPPLVPRLAALVAGEAAYSALLGVPFLALSRRAPDEAAPPPPRVPLR